MTPYKILVAELLLRRTTATAVARIYDDFIERFPDLRALASAETSELEDLLKTIGYQHKRATLIREVARELLRSYGGIPDDLAELLAVNHIGPYAAGAVMSLGYGTPVPMVDTNVVRIFNRLYGKPLEQQDIFNMLRSSLIGKDFKTVNLGFLDFGATVCKYGRPECPICPLKRKCEFFASSEERRQKVVDTLEV